MSSSTRRRPPATQFPRRPDATRVARRSRRGLVDGWLELPWAIRILRAFLGATFVFAGVQKFLDPNFLRSGGADYVGTQLAGFANGTPAAPVMRLLGHAPLAAGIGIALLEIAVGLGTLLGVAMLSAAFIGLAINATLWLSATWHTHPYFLGSDSIYAIAWLALAVGLMEHERQVRGHVAGPIERIDGIDRREFARGALVASAAVALGGVAKAFAGPAPTSGLGAIGARTEPGAGTSPSPSPSPRAGSSPAARATQGRVLTTLDRLPVGGAVGFTDPQVGPAALLRPSSDQVVAFGRTCTHAGCLVGYDQSARMLVCPCHGAEFDPAHHAEPIAGPAPTALPSIKVEVDQTTGDVILPT